MEPGTPRGGPVDPLFDPGPPELQSAGSAWGLGLCQECLGRCFGRLGHGLDNPERARRLGVALGRALPDLPTTGCSLCRGLFDRWETWVARAVAALEGLEGARFSCGSRWEPEILAREEWIWAEIGTPHGESARGAFNREWGKRIEVASGRTGGREEPDLVLLADLPVGRVEVTVQPLYVRGRYRKLDRTIPQTRWPCRRCGGAGCDACGGSGKTYPTSVEELIAAPFLRATEGSDSRFHGMGREDIDARMLGRGRPFVLEIRRPKRRTLDLPVLLAEVHRGAEGRVEVLEARRAGGRDVQLVKEASPSKSYRVGVLGDLSEEKVKEALSLAAGRAIAQRTPTRVSHRRSDLVRTRRIVEAHVVEAAPGRFTLDLRAEAGTYIKEWVEGDDGRTEPNLSAVAGVPLKVDFLDVLEIHDTE